MHSIHSITVSNCLQAGNKSVSFDPEQLLRIISLNQKRLIEWADPPHTTASEATITQDVYVRIPQSVFLFQNIKQKLPKRH